MTIEELIAALEKSVGPSRELDADITLSVIPEFSGWIKHPNLKNDSPSWMHGDLWPDHQQFHEWLMRKGAALSVQASPFTSSIDAAVSLVERVLPDWRIENLCEWDAEILRDQGPWMCDLVQRRLKFFDRQSAKCSHAPTAALALLIATLRAKLSQEKNT